MKKLNLKITAREKWILAILPAVAIGSLYLFGYSDNLAAELTKQQKRVQAAQTPLPAPAPSAALTKAKTALDDAKRSVTDHEARIAKLEESIASAKNTLSAQDNAAPAVAIEKIEAIFARYGLTPVISEAAGQSPGGNQAPANLLAVLTIKNSADSATTSRVWHCVFDGPTAQFERAVKDIVSETPAVVPLSLNLVYNPEDDGETRLLELWLVY